MEKTLINKEQIMAILGKKRWSLRCRRLEDIIVTYNLDINTIVIVSNCDKKFGARKHTSMKYLNDYFYGGIIGVDTYGEGNYVCLHVFGKQL